METEATKHEILLTIKRVEKLKPIVAYFKRQMFVKKSEKSVSEDPDQPSLFKDDLPAVKLDVNYQETEVTFNNPRNLANNLQDYQLLKKYIFIKGDFVRLEIH